MPASDLVSLHRREYDTRQAGTDTSETPQTLFRSLPVVPSQQTHLTIALALVARSSRESGASAYAT
jgi:hypothetical protein